MTKEHHHLLTLLIEKGGDIPRVRDKVKLAARAFGCPRLQVTRLATAASESARLLQGIYHGGKMRLSLVRVEHNGAGLELLFRSRMACGRRGSPAASSCPVNRKQLLAMAPLPVLASLFEGFVLEGGTGGAPVTFRYRSPVAGLAWNDAMLRRAREIRKELFVDTEESYLENLRAKHDEVLELLREKTEQNRILDQANNELLQLSNDLEELARERTIIEMSLKVADSIRNPTTVIGGLARQLVRKGGLPGPVKEKIRQIMTQADQIETIVKQFHQMAAERRSLFGRVDLVQLVRECLQNCHALARKAVTPILEAEREPVVVLANRHVLKVAILNALRHAAKASPEGGEIRVRITATRSGTELAITDQGRGLDDDTLAELAQPAGGVLPAGRSGLLLVRQILAEHQAVLEAENLEPPGHGTRLIMRFPVFWREHGKKNNPRNRKNHDIDQQGEDL
ncbi:MAG TPA: HAMP domain-containing histidine kinase [Desulfobulbus sp.]|nr:HAMP domain-containing histidine kinase [Desulfobulbus sp.]